VAALVRLKAAVLQVQVLIPFLNQEYKMHERSGISGETLRRISQELAGIPVDAALAQSHVEDIEALMQGVDRLRKLPLKALAPPLVFMPEEDVK
jgi:hypothetical protein